MSRLGFVLWLVVMALAGATIFPPLVMGLTVAFVEVTKYMGAGG